MPELPDITAYITALTPRVVGQRLVHLRIASPLLLRTALPPISSVEGKEVRALRRIGKRIVFVFDNELFLVLHLMIAGRLHWRALGAKLGGRNNLAAFDFLNGSLVLTEAGTKRRASLHLVQGEAALTQLDPGGLDIFSLSLEAFRNALAAENHTLKRALTDPRVLSGIGNAYSDEILHAAQLSPLAQTRNLSEEEWQRLYRSTRNTLEMWIARFNAEAQNPSPKRSAPSAPTWQFTAAITCPALGAVRRYSASATQTTRPTTAPPARPAAGSSRTAASPVSSDPTGPAPSMSSKPSSVSDAKAKPNH
jgi:formamidopyrimidine-DNA glycosylase